MRIKSFFITLFITLVLIFVFNSRWGQIPPLGDFLSPREGFWANAEPVNKDFSGRIHVKGVEQRTDVWLDSRLVPHILAQNDHDAYYVQGYVTAMFRLWQMEMQVRAAGGRVSEVIGERGLQYDRLQRRKGMVTAAAHSLAAAEADSATRIILDAYTAGINAYIRSLSYRDFPVEYKLLDYAPEEWTNLKTFLLLKYMSDELSGYTDDLENTNALTVFPRQQFAQLFPDFPDSLYPIIPAGTPFYKPSVKVQPLPGGLADHIDDGVNFKADKPDRDNGSNNWVVSGKKTASGAPILCNDPHLGLNLPSLWFEIQMQTPKMNVYGASLPGAPGVIIGFNNFIAWGVTNAQRDVKDYYAMRFRDRSKQQYWYDGAWKEATRRPEKITVRGSDPFFDTVAYTVFGPVTYDPDFPDTVTRSRYLSVHWAAADSSNELMTFYLLNRARNYDDYKKALSYYQCPAQNFVYADVAGNIAIWQQGKFPARRSKDFGKFILPGDSSIYRWQQFIPAIENPQALDPDRNYLYSANQNPTDSTYPYYYFGHFIQFRARTIDRALASKNDFTADDMMKLQNSYFDAFAAEALPFMLKHLDTAALDPGRRRYLDSLQRWNYDESPESINPVLFNLWWDSLYANIWNDDFKRSVPLPWPTDNTTIEWLLRDTAMPYVDNRNTPQTETLPAQNRDAFVKATEAVRKADTGSGLQWGDYRGTDIMHLTKIPAFSREHLFTGGTGYTVNAIKKDHGPSWRMIVQLSDPVQAYGVYPGGQSGNPGSRYYDNFIDDWLKGKYYPLHYFTREDSASLQVKYRLTFYN